MPDMLRITVRGDRLVTVVELEIAVGQCSSIVARTGIRLIH